MQDRRVQLWVVGIFLALVVGLTIFAAFFSSGVIGNTPTFNATQTSAITASDWTKGPKDAKISVIEYGDFQCPACGAYEPIVEELEKEYATNVLFVFRNFPLFQIHQNAMISAQAAEAAGLQGKYWEMHDLLYAKQNDWAETATNAVVSKYFDAYAQSLGLDVAKFNADIDSAAVKQAVQDDIQAGNAAQVDHTPTFFV